MADGRKVNNDYLTEMADAVDPEGKTSERQLNNELLRRIAEKIGTGGGGGTAPATYETMTESDVDDILGGAYADVDGDGSPDGYMSTEDVDDLVG